MSNLEKKVRIINGYNNSHGMIGTIVDEYSFWYDVKLENGKHVRPNFRILDGRDMQIQCELIEDDFVLPSNWHVVVTPENNAVLANWRFGKGLEYDDDLENKIVGICKPNSNYPKGHNPIGYIKDSDDCYDFGTEITFEQFKKYVLKTKTMNDKKLIGYKCPMDLFMDSSSKVFKGTIFKYNESGYYHANGNHHGSIPKELVESSWEAVYEDTPIKFGNYQVEFKMDHIKIGCKRISLIELKAIILTLDVQIRLGMETSLEWNVEGIKVIVTPLILDKLIKGLEK